MVKLKNPLLSLGARNTISKAITFVRRRSQNIAEKKPEVKDVQSTAQLSWRHMFLKCTALWNALSATEQAQWESLARPLHMTGYAYWQSQCLRPNPGIYLPLQGGTMSGDIDMAKHRILKLPIPVDSQEPVTLAHLAIAANLPTHGAPQHTDVTRDKVVPANSGICSAGAPATWGFYPTWDGGANLNQPGGTMFMKVPDDFVSFTSLKAIWASIAAAGNMFWGLQVFHAAQGEDRQTHFEASGTGLTATGGANIQNVQEPATPLTLPNLALGDFMGIYFYRTGSDASDTLNSIVHFLGVLLTYTASQ